MTILTDEVVRADSKPGVVLRDADVWLDGRFLSYADATISPLSHSLGYATTVYEGVRSYGARLFRFAEHMDRLRASAAVFFHDAPLLNDELHKVCIALLARNNLVDGYVKIQVFFDDSDMSFKGLGCKSRVLVSTAPKPAQKTTPWSLSVADWRRPGPACHPYQAKTSSTYALSFLAHRQRAAWADDILFLTEPGIVCESSGANIGFIADKTIVMPTTACSLAGVTRRVIIEDLAPQLGLGVSVRDIHVDELGGFEGAFLCGTAVEVKPVARIEDVNYHRFEVQHALAQALVAMATPGAEQ